jgi:hypothetical protein
MVLKVTGLTLRFIDPSMEKFKTLHSFQVSVSALRLQVFISLKQDSVLDVFTAANVPIVFDVLRDFTFEDLANR